LPGEALRGKAAACFPLASRAPTTLRPIFVARALTRTKHERIMHVVRTQEGWMARHMVFALRELWELASLGAFLMMIALAARAFGA